MDESQQITSALFSFVLHFALAIGIGLLGLVLARWVRRAVRKLVAAPRVADYLSPSIRELVIRLAFYLVLILGFGLALIALGVPSTYVIGGMAIILLIAGVALQQSLANLTATIIFFTYQPFRRGELIETMGNMGVVQEIQLFNTVLLTADGRLVSLANAQVQEAGVVNYSRQGSMRADIILTLAYSTDLSHVRKLLFDLVQRDSRVLSDPAADFVVLAMGDTGVQVALRVFARTEDYWMVLFELRERATALLASEGIHFARNLNTVTLTPAGENAPAAQPETATNPA